MRTHEEAREFCLKYGGRADKIIADTFGGLVPAALRGAIMELICGQDEALAEIESLTAWKRLPGAQRQSNPLNAAQTMAKANLAVIATNDKLEAENKRLRTVSEPARKWYTAQLRWQMTQSPIVARVAKDQIRLALGELQDAFNALDRAAGEE